MLFSIIFIKIVVVACELIFLACGLMFFVWGLVVVLVKVVLAFRQFSPLYEYYGVGHTHIENPINL